MYHNAAFWEERVLWFQPPVALASIFERVNDVGKGMMVSKR